MQCIVITLLEVNDQSIFITSQQTVMYSSFDAASLVKLDDA